MKKAIFLQLLALAYSAAVCSKYSCKPASMKFRYEQCIYPATNHFYLNKCSNSRIPFCQPSASSQNITCAPTIPESTYKVYYPGEPCTMDSNCLNGVCQSGVCNSLTWNEQCFSNADCNPGFYCNNKRCDFQIKEGFTGCTTDESCVNNCGCNKGTNNNKCIKYLSLLPNTEVLECANNYNPLCTTTMCGEKNGKYYCSQSVSSKTLPLKCTDKANCTSTVDSFLGKSLLSECECGNNPNGDMYCGLFPGDDIFSQYLTYLTQWYTSEELKLCHTDRRTSPTCMYAYWDYSSTVNLLYYKNYKIYNAIFKREEGFSLH